MIEVNYDEAAPIEIDSYGAEVTSTPYPTTTGRRTIGLQLPAPVTAGDRHDFELALFEPRLNRIERHVYVPAVACRNLELRVHFQVSTAPRAVTRLAGDTCPTDPAEPEVILVNSCGEVATRFHDLHTGRPHGLSWKPPPQEGVSDHGLRATAPNSSTSRW
jgi:hypothetical protein